MLVCVYINSMDKLIRGEYIPVWADKILVHYDQLFCNPFKINDGDIVYCDTHHISRFKDILNIKKDITIITHNSDYCLYDGPTSDPNGVNVEEFTSWTQWYGQNSYSTKDNVIPLPIGFENLRWERNFGPKTKWMTEVKDEQIDPTNAVYLNCNIGTNLKDRKECYEKACQLSFVTCDEPNLSYKDYLRKIKSHKFTLSPRGNGLDCHRTWEIFMMERIPIIKKEGSLERLYKGLPVFFVDDWDNLRFLDLNATYERIKHNRPDLNFEKLNLRRYND